MHNQARPDISAFSGLSTSSSPGGKTNFQANQESVEIYSRAVNFILGFVIHVSRPVCSQGSSRPTKIRIALILSQAAPVGGEKPRGDGLLLILNGNKSE